MCAGDVDGHLAWTEGRESIYYGCPSVLLCFCCDDDESCLLRAMSYAIGQTMNDTANTNILASVMTNLSRTFLSTEQVC